MSPRPDAPPAGVAAGAPTGSARPDVADPAVVRFDAIERTVHWVTATVVLVSLATAAALFVGPVAAAVGRREDVRWLHVAAGLLIPAPLVAGLIVTIVRRRGLLLADLRRIDRWTEDERRWLRGEGSAGLRLDKFNPGQKLNAAFTGGAVLVLTASGAVMRWFEHFPLAWRSGASVVHDLTAAALTVTLLGHVLMALTHPASLRSMVTGRVPASWARRHAPRWLDEQAAAGANPGGTG